MATTKYGGFSSSQKTVGDQAYAETTYNPSYPSTGILMAGVVMPTMADTLTDPTAPVTLPDIDTSGAPGTFTDLIDHTTTWPTLELDLETPPDLHVAEHSEETAVDPSTEYTGTVTIPDETAEEFSGTFTPGSHVTIPVPPSITLTAWTGTIPTFTVSTPNHLIEWAYETYASSLLTSLKTDCDALLTDPVKVDYTGARARDKQIWDSPSLFLISRGISPLPERYAYESALLRLNIERLIAIAEGDVTPTRQRQYVQLRQLLEDLERGIYEGQKEGEFAYAKAYAENRLSHYVALIQSYNQLLDAYRMQSLWYQEQVKLEKDKLEDYKGKIAIAKATNQVNQVLLKEYAAQIEIVNSTIKSYEISMSVSEAIANITLLSAEMDRLNTESFVLQTKALADATDASVYFKETEILKLELEDADLEYVRAGLEKQAAVLERTIGMIEEQINDKNFEGDRSLSNARAIIEKNRATYWARLARAELSGHYYQALEARAKADRDIEDAETEGTVSNYEMVADIDVSNYANLVARENTYMEFGVGASVKCEADNLTNYAEAYSAYKRAEASNRLNILQTIIESESE